MSDGELNAPTRGIEFAPAPTSFVMAEVEADGRDLRAISTNGVAVLLSSAQADLTAPERIVTSRLVRAVTGRDGLQAVARFDAAFDARFERLIIHGIKVIRDGVARDEGRPEAFELMRREPNLERAIYDGRMTAHMVLPDIREGDIVDICYSIIGEQPSLNGAFSWFFVLQWSTRVVETTCRLITPPSRRMLVRRFGGAPRPRVMDRSGRRVYTWIAHDVQPYEPEPFAPAWSVGYQAVEIADAMTWSGVSDLFRVMYEGAITDGTPPIELATEVQAIMAREASAAARAVEGLRLVQRTLRYHSVAIGEGGFRPRALRTIWSTRYGDCKDASVLLTSVLRQMGLDACCALVNVGLGGDLSNAIPSPRAFNHCIVRLRHEGREYWLDGTMAPQAGDLGVLTQARFGWALPLTPNAELSRVDRAPMAVVREVAERWTFFRDVSRPARLECETIHRGWRADETRRMLDNRDSSSVAEVYREQLERELNSPLRASSDLQIVDSPATNTLTVREFYEVERALTPAGSQGRQFMSFDDVVRPNLPVVDAGPRREPIALGPARQVVTRRQFNFAVPTNFSPWDERIQGPGGLEGRARFEWIDRRSGVHTISLKVPNEVLPANQAGAYRAFLQRLYENSGVGFVLRTRGGRFVSTTGEDGTPWGWIAWAVVITMIAAARCSGVA